MVLYLVCSAAESCWYAIDAPRDVEGGASAILELGHRIFRTYDNAVEEGSWSWERNLNGPGQTTVWKRLCPFKTAVLQ